MHKDPHRIRKQSWIVRVGSAADAFAWRKLLRDQWQDLLLPVLEKAFDEVVQGERVLHIPKIELQVQIDSARHPPESLPDLLIQQLQEQLQSMLQDQMRSAGQPDSWNESTTRINRFEILLHYLRTGSVPWQAAFASTSAEADALTETCCEQWPHLMDHLQHRQESAPFFFRLLQLISEEECLSLVRALSARASQELQTAAEQCIRVLLAAEQAILSRHTRLQLAAGFLSQCSSWQEDAAAHALFSIAINAVPPEERPGLHGFISSLPASAAALLQGEKPGGERGADGAVVALSSEVDLVPDSMSSLQLGRGEIDGSGATSHGFPSSLPESVAVRLRHAKPGGDRDADGASAELLQEAHKMAAPVHSLNLGNGAAPGAFDQEASSPGFPFADEYPARRQPTEDLFPLTVHQAGLVLLHPFITRLFAHTGIMEKGEPKLASFALTRAAALLHFTATGREPVYEYELGLIKVLLGLHPHTVLLVCEGLLEARAREEVGSLLQAAITHWSALKSTSIDGLRSSFLQRQALLREEEHGWKLQVERKPFDVLLDQLPWSISIVKLPWMKKAVYTEW
jgi:hypothetical protein